MIRSKKGILWGIYLILAAVLIIALQMGSFAYIGFWSIAATVLLVAILIESLLSLNFVGILIAVAILYMIYDGPLGLTPISPWILILSAVLAGSGLQLIVRRGPRRWHGRGDVRGTAGCHGVQAPPMETHEAGDDAHPYFKVSLGAASKYLHTDCLESGQFYVSLGALEVYFDRARLSPNGAEVTIDCNMGSVKLYIPREWQVRNGLSTSLGAVEDAGRDGAPAEDAPVLSLIGSVRLGSVEIQYI